MACSVDDVIIIRPGCYVVHTANRGRIVRQVLVYKRLKTMEANKTVRSIIKSDRGRLLMTGVSRLREVLTICYRLEKFWYFDGQVVAQWEMVAYKR